MRLLSPDSLASDESLPLHIIPINFQSKTGYSTYESAPSDVRFSEEYIEQLTVGHLMAPDFHIPHALAEGAVELVGWSPEEPTTGQMPMLLTDGRIPSLRDIRTFLSEQSVRYRDGFRSAVVQVHGTYTLSRSMRSRSSYSDLTGTLYTVHFRDVRLWSNIGLLRTKASKIMAVAENIRSQNLLDLKEYGTFLECSASTSLQGFPKSYATVSFTHLHELLDENWIGEQILDARGYQVMQAINRSMGSSTVLFLPSIFHTQLSVAFHARKFSTALKALRGSLLEDLPHFIAFVFNKDLTHWAPCVISVEDRIVRQGDSLEWASDANMLPMIRWLLGDITRQYGEWKETLLAVPRQGASSGSCGIVAMSAIERFIV